MAALYPVVLVETSNTTRIEPESWQYNIAQQSLSTGGVDSLKVVMQDVGSYGSAARNPNRGVTAGDCEEARKCSEEDSRGKGGNLGCGG